MICSFALSEIVSPLIPQGVVLLHYLDDFLLVCANVELLASVTKRVAKVLARHAFIFGLFFSTLSPVTRIFFLGKWLDLTARTLTPHPCAFLQLLAAWLRVAVRTAKHSCLTGKLVGFLQWHFRPNLGMGPLFAGAYCWMRWGAHDLAIPLCVWHVLSTTMALSREAWTPPLTAICRVFDSMSCSSVDVFDLYGPIICVDAAWDLHGHRAGGVLLGHGVRSRCIVARDENP